MNIVSYQSSGLGNQLFQYAASRYYAGRYGASVRLITDRPEHTVSHGNYPRPFLLPHVSISTDSARMSSMDRLFFSRRRSLKPAISVLKRLLGVQVFREAFERRYDFLPELPLEAGVGTVYLVGYWQTYRIAQAIEPELRRDLKFKQPAVGKNAEILERIAACPNPVSLHVRRGDYTLAVEGHRTLSMDYYARAIAHIRERLADPVFFIFSDDIPYVRSNLSADLPAVFVDHNDDATCHEDLRLMSACHHHIIANSTFSWWGAWLNPRAEKIVLAPKYWYLTPESYYPELLPPNWTLALP
jgi:hypothetical protein